MLKAYLEQHFQLNANHKKLILNGVGLELNKAKVTIYQSVNRQNFLSGLVVKNEILVDTYTK